MYGYLLSLRVESTVDLCEVVDLKLKFFVLRLKLEPGPENSRGGEVGETPGMLNLVVRHSSRGPRAAADPPAAELASCGPVTPPRPAFERETRIRFARSVDSAWALAASSSTSSS